MILCHFAEKCLFWENPCIVHFVVSVAAVKSRTKKVVP